MDGISIEFLSDFAGSITSASILLGVCIGIWLTLFAISFSEFIFDKIKKHKKEKEND